VIASKADIVRVAFERGDQGLGGVIPDLDGPVVARSAKLSALLILMDLVVSRVMGESYVRIYGLSE
jgi:hypothetical protein